MKHLKVISFLFIILPLKLHAQASELIVNSYFHVNKVLYNELHLAPDTLILSKIIDDTDTLKEGDTVLIHQTKGVKWIYEQDNYDDLAFTGRFEFHVIQKIRHDTVVLVSRLDWLDNTNTSYEASDSLQLIKVPTFKHLHVNTTLTCKPWNGSTGGILTLIADTIELNADINVSNKGFQGADPNNIKGNPICTKDDSIGFAIGDFSFASVDSGGLKGESVVPFDNNLRRGNKDLYTGGGGGNGYHSGGGGGSNFGEGGRGGDEGYKCESKDPFTGGYGGQAGGTTIYLLNDLRALMGGGGGASTVTDTFTASKGGNGGGIIILMANTFIANNHKVVAAGEDVTKASSSGAGGGGGGGAVLLDVNHYIGSPTISVRGGNGGSTFSRDTAGPGGGGGAGIIFYNGKSIPAKLDTIYGKTGQSIKGKQNAQTGNNGFTLGGLIMPVNDFLFNVMPARQEICAGETPKRILASKPKGGNGTYTYEWYQSNDLNNWNKIAGATDTTYQPGTLMDTTYYYRIVYSIDMKGKPLAPDKGTILAINVLPAIKSDSIYSDTNAVCYGTQFPIINGTIPTKGNGEYSYFWVDSISKTNVDTVLVDKPNYNPNPLLIDSSKWIIRVVKSGVCTSRSNIKFIKVLPPLDKIEILDTQWVEMGRKPDTLYGKQYNPIGGNGKYHFKWEFKTNSSNWKSHNADTLRTLDLPKTDTTKYYRRLIYSGQFNTCRDTSNILSVTILDSLYNNTITGSSKICAKTQPAPFTTPKPLGGDHLTYHYLWQSRKASEIQWSDYALVDDTIFQAGALDSTTHFRRIVFSGTKDACKDTSNSILILVKPYITDNKIFKSDTTICSKQFTGLLKSQAPTVSDGPPSFNWQYKTGNSDWNSVPGTFDNSDYSGMELYDTTLIRRVVVSGVCTGYSDTVNFTVLPLISGNTIGESQVVCKATSPNELTGPTPIGGDGKKYSYQWITSQDQNSWPIAPDKSDSISYIPRLVFDRIYYKRIAFSGPSNCCIDTTTNTVVIDIKALPTGEFSPVSASMCQDSFYTIPLTLTGKTPVDIKYFDGYDTTILQNISDLNYNLIYNPKRAFNYHIMLTSIKDANGCFAQSLSGNADLKAYERPKAFAGLDTAVCGQDITLNAKPSIGKGFWFPPAGTTFIDSASNPKAQTHVVSFGEQDFIWKETNGTCSDTSLIHVTFYEQPGKPDAGIDQGQDGASSRFLFSTSLHAKIPDVSTSYYWIKPSLNISLTPDSTDPNAAVSNLDFGNNVFVWKVINGVCEPATDTVVISTSDIKIPGGFSPNNDTINDFFVIRGLLRVDEKDLTIINKWGKVVYHNANYQNDWDGTSNGANLPFDTYFYILKTYHNRTYKGYVVIKR